jgi:hypothetical protein
MKLYLVLALCIAALTLVGGALAANPGTNGQPGQ